ESRDGVGPGGVEAGDHVGAGRAGGADAHADVAGLGAGVALGHVRGAFDVACQDVADAAVSAQGGIQRVERGTGDAEGRIDAYLAQYRDGRIDYTNSGQRSFLQTLRTSAQSAARRPCCVKTRFGMLICTCKLECEPSPLPCLLLPCRYLAHQIVAVFLFDSFYMWPKDAGLE